MKTKPEMTVCAQRWVDNIRVHSALKVLAEQLSERGLPEINGFFDRGEGDVLPLMVRNYGVPEHVLRADEMIRSRWEYMLLTGEALSDLNHPAWNGDVDEVILESIRLHKLLEVENHLDQAGMPWSGGEFGTVTECDEFMDHQVALFVPSATHDAQYTSVSKPWDVFVELSCNLFDPGGAVQWDFNATLTAKGRPLAEISGKLVAVDAKKPLTLDPEDIFACADADFEGQYLNSVVIPMQKASGRLGEGPMDIFTGARFNTSILHIETVDCLKKYRTIEAVSYLIQGVQAALTNPELYDFEFQTIMMGLQWGRPETYRLLNRNKFDSKGHNMLSFRNVGAVVIESPLADMIELTHHIKESQELRESMYKAVAQDRFLSHLSEHLNKTFQADSDALPTHCMFYTPTLEGERIVRIGEQTLLRGLESDLYSDGY